jgi:PmbA protein
MIDDVSQALAKDARFSAWQVTDVRGRSTQRYQTLTAVDTRRVVETHACEVRVHVQHADGTMGESSFTVVDAARVSGMLDAAFMRAQLVKNKPWTLPSASDAGEVAVRTVDPRVVESAAQVADEVGEAIVKQTRENKGTELSMSEVFCDFRRIQLRNSRGLEKTREDTAVYTEYVLLAPGKGNEELEVYQSKRARTLADLAIAQQVDGDIEAAREAKDAVLPESGTCDVVLTGGAVEELFDAFVAHATASSKFEGWSRFADGAPILGDDVTGDALTLASDATVAGGLGSYAFDDVGIAGRIVPCIVNGTFTARAADRRHACWLDVPTTGAWGNTVVASGPTSEAELCVPTSGRALYVLSRFSQLAPHVTSGALSGEIRFGHRISAGATGVVRAPVRGGSLSTNVFDAFKSARFSSERAVRGRLVGPRSVRLDGVQITG